MKQKLLLILMLVSFYTSIAQRSGASETGTITVTEVNSFLSSNRGSATARVASSSGSPSTVNVQRLSDLLTQVQSSSYFLDGVVKTYGEAPTNLFTNVASLGQVNNSIADKQNIEIATIEINTMNELNSNIDLAAFSNFPNLKYIYFISYVNTTSANIANHILNYDGRVSIFYKIDKGDRNQ